MNKRQIIYIALIVILLIVFIVSAIYVINYFTEAQESKDEFNDLAAIMESVQAQTTPSTQPTAPTTDASGETGSAESLPGQETAPTEPVMLPEYAVLYAMNPDIVGWIKIDNTKINYPVMQTPDRPDHYLKRDFEGNYSAWGCIYVREQCDVDKPSDNVTIYGHHMNDGSMFAPLDKFMKEDYWKTNNLITFDTLYEHRTYQIFSVFKTTASVGKGFSYHLMVDAETEAEFNEFIATCKDLALYDTGITPVYGDKVICLSTCEYSQTNGRLVVVAVLVE